MRCNFFLGALTLLKQRKTFVLKRFTCSATCIGEFKANVVKRNDSLRLLSNYLRNCVIYYFLFISKHSKLSCFKEICQSSVFTGVGGIYDCPFPWKRWKKCAWFEAAIAVVSFNIKKMDKLIPGYRNFDQSLQTDYIGLYYIIFKNKTGLLVNMVKAHFVQLFVFH